MVGSLLACMTTSLSVCLFVSHLVYWTVGCLLINKSRAQSYAKRLKTVNAFRQFVFVFDSQRVVVVVTTCRPAAAAAAGAAFA